MKNKKSTFPENYLDKIPLRHSSVKWKTNSEGIVILEIENTGWANKIAQIIFKRPKISYVSLDKMGSFIWQVTNGEKSITAIGALVDEKFGKEAHPLFERLAKYFQIMKSYNFITWVEPKTK